MVARPLWLILKMTPKLEIQLKKWKLVFFFSPKFKRNGTLGLLWHSLAETRNGTLWQRQAEVDSRLQSSDAVHFSWPHNSPNLPSHLISMKSL